MMINGTLIFLILVVMFLTVRQRSLTLEVMALRAKITSPEHLEATIREKEIAAGLREPDLEEPARTSSEPTKIKCMCGHFISMHTKKECQVAIRGTQCACAMSFDQVLAWSKGELK